MHSGSHNRRFIFQDTLRFLRVACIFWQRLLLGPSSRDLEAAEFLKLCPVSEVVSKRCDVPWEVHVFHRHGPPLVSSLFPRWRNFRISLFTRFSFAIARWLLWLLQLVAQVRVRARTETGRLFLNRRVPARKLPPVPGGTRMRRTGCSPVRILSDKGAFVFRFTALLGIGQILFRESSGKLAGIPFCSRRPTYSCPFQGPRSVKAGKCSISVERVVSLVFVRVWFIFVACRNSGSAIA